MPIKALAFDAFGTLFDPASVTASVEAAWPGRGAFISGVWRQKQLEYTWQRTAMGRYADFATLTREALDYAVRTVDPAPDESVVERLCSGFERLDLMPEAADALDRLAGRKLAVLSNGSGAMLAALLAHGGIASSFPVVVGSDCVRAYKPHPDMSRAVVDALGLEPHEVALVSGNGFDIAGARHSGLATIRVERLPPDRMQAMAAHGDEASATTAFAALRSQVDPFAGEPDHVCRDLFGVVAFADRSTSG